MHIRNELTAMAERMFSDDLLDTILAAYKEEMDDAECGISEEEYRKGAKVLSSALNERQKSDLSEMERLCNENIKYALRFGFMRGVYAGFQQHFTEDSAEQPFHKLVENQLLTEPQMERYPEYCQRRDDANELYHTLEKQLPDNLKEHIISIYAAWDNRLYGVLRYAFYLGYRYALSAVKDVAPIGAILPMMKKILRTEHELGFSNTTEKH